MSVDEYVDDGMHFDEVKEVCKLAQEAGVDSISLSAGCYDAVDYAIQPMYIPQGFIIPFAEELKKEVSIPVIVAARLNNAELIQEIVNSNKADIVAIGRGLIADPELITKIENDDLENIRYCIACNQGCIDRVLGGMHAHCLVNPIAGEEESRKLNKIDTDKTIAVIGGGPAGMQAAITAKDRGYDVNLYTNEDLGGKLKTVAVPPEKESFLIFLNYLEDQVNKRNIPVIKKEVKTFEDIKGDAVIIATGSVQNIPPIPGIDNKNVVYAEDILNGLKTVEAPVVVIGAGLVGTETCKYLGSEGIKPITLVEMKDNIAEGIGATFVGHMFEKLNEYDVKIITSATVKEITPDSVVLEDETLKAKTVVIATGYKPVNELIEIFKDKIPVSVIGDANQPRRILDATEEAFLAANEI